jgi:hypothetical protein
MEAITGEMFGRLQIALGAQAEPVQPCESWLGFVGSVKALHKRTKCDVRVVYHPYPELSTINCENGSVMVLTGERRAVLKTGEIMRL